MSDDDQAKAAEYLADLRRRHDRSGNRTSDRLSFNSHQTVGDEAV